MGCVTKTRVRAVRHALNPSAPELPDAAFVVGRIVLLGLAGVGVFTTIQLMDTSDRAEWNDDELTRATGQAATALDGSSRFGDIFGDDSGFDEYATMIEDEVVERTRSKGDDYEPPGVAGGPGAVTVPSYRFAVSSRAGDC